MMLRSDNIGKEAGAYYLVSNLGEINRVQCDGDRLSDMVGKDE